MTSRQGLQNAMKLNEETTELLHMSTGFGNKVTLPLNTFIPYELNQNLKIFHGDHLRFGPYYFFFLRISAWQTNTCKILGFISQGFPRYAHPKFRATPTFWAPELKKVNLEETLHVNF